MRDRRTTNLSTSSTFSTDSAVTETSRASLNEKRAPSPPPIFLPEFATKENHSRPNSRIRDSRILQAIGIVCCIIGLWYFVLSPSWSPISSSPAAEKVSISWPDLIGEHILPDEPSAIRVHDSQGRAKWTVHIPQNYSFPLQSDHVQNTCKQSEVLRDELSPQSRMMAVKDWRRKGSYYVPDNTFLDIDAAESMGAIPTTDTANTGSICDRSLTLVLDAEDTSFGRSLLIVWLSYGLAKKEGRAFFVDDSNWLYGQYNAFFAPLPPSKCTPPPAHRIVPCPHTAKHLLVSSATVPWTFGAAFEREFSQTWRSGVAKSRRIYDLLRTGYEDLFHLRSEDASWASNRIGQLKENAHRQGNSIIGIHLRRGDLHPFEYQFSQDYLPLERYGTAAVKLRKELEPHISISSEGGPHCPLLLATDDPETLDRPELRHSAQPFDLEKAQERISLATKATLDLSSPAAPVADPDSVYTKHVTENAGWDGGFYSALFHSLGKSSDNDDDLSEQAVQMRELVGRAYLLDLAVLGSSDGVVCASSSATCRLLGVMLGFDAVTNGRWVNVDDKRVWSWDGRR